MQPVSTVEAFLAAPLGRYFVGRRYVAWCWDASLCGTCLWGKLGREDLLAVTCFFTWKPCDVGLACPFDMISDCARIESIDTDGYAVVADRFRGHLNELTPMLRRHAFVHGGGFLGAVMAGIFPLAVPEQPWRAFERLDEAFAWLDNPSAGAALEEVRELVARIVGSSPALDALRAYLRGCRGAATLQQAARALGRSERSLQRDLGESGSSFRAEQGHARLEAARTLLIESDRKLEAIASDVGCSSLAQFSRLFRRLTGEAPSEFRARHRT